MTGTTVGNLSHPPFRRRTRDAHIFDLDGTCTHPNGDRTTPHPVTRALKSAMRKLFDRGDLIIFATGAPLCLARKIVTSMGLPLNEVIIAPDYGSVVFRPDRGDHDPQYTVPMREIDALKQIRLFAEMTMRVLRGRVDTRDVRAQMNVFWSTVEEFEVAHRAWDMAVAQNETVRDLFQGTSDGGRPALRTQWNKVDHSMNILPYSAGKVNIVHWANNRGFRVMTAAGDTGSDVPLLKAARFPIATIAAKGERINQELLSIVLASSDGYTAQPEDWNGIGLARGIREFMARYPAPP